MNPMATNSAVTLKPKCYVFVCVGCRRLADSERSDALTCSTACRVKAHRNGEMKKLRKLAKDFEITAASVVQHSALEELVPALAAEVLSGRDIDDDEIRRTVWATYCQRVAECLALITENEVVPDIGTRPVSPCTTQPQPERNCHASH